MSMMRSKSSSLAPPSTSALLFALLSQSMAVLRIIEATRAQDEIAEEARLANEVAASAASALQAIEGVVDGGEHEEGAIFMGFASTGRETIRVPPAMAMPDAQEADTRKNGRDLSRLVMSVIKVCQRSISQLVPASQNPASSSSSLLSPFLHPIRERRKEEAGAPLPAMARSSDEGGSPSKEKSSGVATPLDLFGRRRVLAGREKEDAFHLVQLLECIARTRNILLKLKREEPNYFGVCAKEIYFREIRLLEAGIITHLRSLREIARKQHEKHRGDVRQRLLSGDDGEDAAWAVGRGAGKEGGREGEREGLRWIEHPTARLFWQKHFPGRPPAGGVSSIQSPPFEPLVHFPPTLPVKKNLSPPSPFPLLPRPFPLLSQTTRPCAGLVSWRRSRRSGVRTRTRRTNALKRLLFSRLHLYRPCPCAPPRLARGGQRCPGWKGEEKGLGKGWWPSRCTTV
ncbi:hypothetical protein Naga_100423g1 [Nannochloropsis gaditana]|uniref:Uncharacterized protein n=1 Tax=Nannochloropsis gaditana TaxID=72520 RepID=W7TB74_9STRA|nr:hypothetical protein Naga_100423g1 [Nannochloropsis gaditana]